SLLEGLVFAERVARDLETVSPLDATPPARDWRVPPLTDRGAAQVAANMVRDTMWKYAGIVRSADGLGACLATLEDIERRLPKAPPKRRIWSRRRASSRWRRCCAKSRAADITAPISRTRVPAGSTGTCYGGAAVRS